MRALLAAILICLAPTPAAHAADRASWYGQGARTANGERFYPDGITCAHRTFRFGTRVRVTNLRNGRSVVCRVNDRGPAAWTGKQIDMSRGAARVLGMIHAGVVAVRIQVVR